MLRPVLPQAQWCSAASALHCTKRGQRGLRWGSTVQGTRMARGAVCAMSQPTGASGNDAGTGEHPQAETPEQKVKRRGCTCPSLLTESIWAREQNQKARGTSRGRQQHVQHTGHTHTPMSPKGLWQHLQPKGKAHFCSIPKGQAATPGPWVRGEQQLMGFGVIFSHRLGR